MKAYYK